MSAAGPLVSVLINNYNYARFLREAIDSALGQTYPRIEVIVVDDGSTDSSREIIRSYGARVMPVLQENRGQASALNAGFAAAHGEWICLLDSDDVWLTEKVEKVVEGARARPDTVLIYHRVQPVSVDLRPIRKIFPAALFRGDISARVKSGGGWWSAVPTSALCFSRQVMQRIGNVPENDFPICADAYLYSIAPLLGPVFGITDSLVQYRQHDTSYLNGASARAGGRAAIENLRWRRQIIEKVLARVNSRLDELRTGIVLDPRRHWEYQQLDHLLGTAGPASTLRLSWKALRLPGQPSAASRLRAAGGLLLGRHHA